MTENEFYELYWNYYLQLENDFFDLEPFCSLDKINNNSFSIKYLQLTLSICGEIDTICKRLCYCLDNAIDVDKVGIDDYRTLLMKHYPQIAEEIVEIERHDYRKITPFKSWAHEHNPVWWNAYNQMKHHRDEKWSGKTSYKHATQKNVVDALAGLYIVITYWAAYTFVLNGWWQNDGWSQSPTMERLKSTRLTMENWESFYQGTVGPKRFNPNECRRYFYHWKEYSNE